MNARAARALRRPLLIAFCTVLPALASSAVARAHIMEEYDSVHFNSGKPDFGTLPRRGMMYDENDIRPGSDYDNAWWQKEVARKQELSDEKQQNVEAARAKREKRQRAQAIAAAAQGKWSQAQTIYASVETDLHGRGNLQSCIEAVQVAARQSQPLTQSQQEAVTDYLHGMNLMAGESGKALAEAVFQRIAADSKNGFLRPYARYQLAAMYSLSDDSPSASLREYAAILQDSPATGLREKVLIMQARAAILPGIPSDFPTGASALQTLLREFPQTRFRPAARGLQAKLDYHHQQFGPAIETYFSLGDMPSVEAVLKQLPAQSREPYYPRLLAGYLRNLDRAEDYFSFSAAISGIRSRMAALTPGGATAFVAQLRREPSLAAPYFYYRLYHCENTEHDLQNLARLATRLAALYPESTLPRSVQIRLAEVFYQDDQYQEALAWSQRLIGPAGHPYDRALYVHGASLGQMGRSREALADFDALLASCPKSSLRFASHEERAILREATGDLSGALDDYFVLDYRPDIAFFLDARMTTDQVAAYVASHPHHKEHDLLAYSLGIRYLREENWVLAKRWLRSLPRSTYNNMSMPGKDRDGYIGWDPDGPPPLKAVADLSRLRGNVDRATTENSRSAALFAYASYYYKNGLLLLYNGALWNGRREVEFDFCWNDKHATKSDDDFARRHMYAHEVYARTEAVCREIAKKYPHSPFAPLALYRAACCEDKLAGFNGWWREESHRHQHSQAAANLMSQFVRKYPHHELTWEARKFSRVWNEEAADERKEWADEAKERKAEERREAEEAAKHGH